MEKGKGHTGLILAVSYSRKARKEVEGNHNARHSNSQDKWMYYKVETGPETLGRPGWGLKVGHIGGSSSGHPRGRNKVLAEEGRRRILEAQVPRSDSSLSLHSPVTEGCRGSVSQPQTVSVEREQACAQVRESPGRLKSREDSMLGQLKAQQQERGSCRAAR